MKNISELLDRGRKINSRLILAIDLHSFENDLYGEIDLLMSKLKKYVVAIKIGLPTIISLGVDKLRELLHNYSEYYFIADMKIADVGHINRILCRYASYMGFDAVISHSIIGFEGGLKEVVEEIHGNGGAVFALCSMTHPGAQDIYNKNFELMLNISIKAGVDGFVLPATQPDYINKTRRVVGNSKVIISPGVIFQGAKIGTAISYGADFEIIGRAIYKAKDPVKVAEEYRSVLGWD